MVNLNDSHIYLSRDVILDLLKRREYDTSAYEHYTQEDILSMLSIIKKTTQKNTQTPLDMVCKHKNIDKYIHVCYFFGSKLKIQTVENIIASMIKHDIFKTDDDEVIFISDEKISNEALFDNQLDGLYKKRNSKYFTQVFDLSKLIINIMKHELVPEHTIISEEEKNKLLLKFDIAHLSQLPIILKIDPVAKFIGMKRGDVCEIRKSSETGGECIVFRYCQ